jgi:hypothetical protein
MKANEKSVSAILAVLAIAVLCVISYRLGAKNASESRSNSMEMEQTDTSSEAERSPDSPPVSYSSSPVADDPAVAANDGTGDGGAKDDIAEEQRERLMRNIAENLAMPGMNEMIQQQQRVLMEDKYRSFIKKLRLSPQEEEYLMDLLTARQMLQVDFGMKLMTGMLSEAERTELMEDLHSGMEELEKEIDWFLNNETDSDYFRYYDKTEGERAAVLSVENALSQAGHPFDEGVGEELVAILYEELNSYPFSVEFEENGEPVFSSFTDANISTFLQELEQMRDPVFREATLIMGPEQLEIFQQYYAQYVLFYEQRLRMTQQFFNANQ